MLQGGKQGRPPGAKRGPKGTSSTKKTYTRKTTSGKNRAGQAYKQSVASRRLDIIKRHDEQLNKLKQQHKTELEKKDAEIAELKAQLDGHSYATLAVEKDRHMDLVRDWMKEVVFEPNRCGAAVSRLGMSMRQFILLRQHLFRKFQPGEDEMALGDYEPFYFPASIAKVDGGRKEYTYTNIQLPLPPGRVAVQNRRLALAKAAGVRADPSGRGAFVDFPKAVAAAIANTPLSLIVEMCKRKIPFELNQFVDAHGLYNPAASHASEWALRTPQVALFPSSPHCLTHLGMWEGKDDYDNILVNTQDAMRWLRMLRYDFDNMVHCYHPEAEQGITIKVLPTLSGDLVALKNQSGNCRSHAHDEANCIWCCANKVDLTYEDGVPTTPDGYTYNCEWEPRTYEFHAHAGHMFTHDGEKEFDCPCCGTHITRENQSELLRGMSKTEREDHPKTHHGQAIGRRPVFPIDMEHIYICVCHARKNLTGRLFKHGIQSRITTDTQALKVHNYITKVLGIDLPKSFVKKRTDKVDEWNRVPSFQGRADDDILINFITILEMVCDKDKLMDRRHFDDTLFVLSKLLDWRNAVYTRHGTTFPSEQQLKNKHKLVSKAATALYEAFTDAYDKATPYLHAILHNEAWLRCDVVDRSAEALEHLNKIMKSITKRGLKRYTNSAKREAQIAKAKAAGKSTPSSGIHKGASGTCLHALTESVARTEWAKMIPFRHDYRERQKHAEGTISKQLVALKMGDFPSLESRVAI